MLRVIKLLISSLLLGLFYVSSSAQSLTDTLVIYFRQNSTDYDSTYMDNAQRLKAVKESIKDLQKYPDFKVTKMDCFASASPEGSVILNEYLSRMRVRTAVDLLKGTFELPDSVYTHTSLSEDWDSLFEILEEDENVPDRDMVLKIIKDTKDNVEKEKQIRTLNVKAWNYISWKYFRYLRSLRVYIYMTYTIPVPDSDNEEIKSEVLEDEKVEVESPQIEVPQIEVPSVVKKQISNKKITLKTNFIGWAFFGANLAVEFDLTPHLSLSIPFHYSGGVEYRETLKFRGATVQPELRYYPWLNNGRNQGFFLGLHAGAGLYNFAIEGDYRYQDKDGKRPAYGGGLGLGYSFRFGKNTGWGMEFAVGGGVYDAEYDIFYNEENGPYYKRGVHKLWYGVDNASISLFYKFNLKKKGGDK